MISTVIEGKIGYLVLKSGIKYAFSDNVKEVISLVDSCVTYLTIDGKNKKRVFVNAGGCVSFLIEVDI